jgi:hypothetical protein
MDFHPEGRLKRKLRIYFLMIRFYVRMKKISEVLSKPTGYHDVRYQFKTIWPHYPWPHQRTTHHFPFLPRKNQYNFYSVLKYTYNKKLMKHRLPFPLIHPKSIYKLMWNQVTLIVLIYQAIYNPYELVFLKQCNLFKNRGPNELGYRLFLLDHFCYRYRFELVDEFLHPWRESWK